MSRKKNRKKNFIKQIAVVDKTPVKQEERFTSTMVLRATTSRLPAKIRYSTRHRLGFHATRFM